jgi:hypothetical protein
MARSKKLRLQNKKLTPDTVEKLYDLLKTCATIWAQMTSSKKRTRFSRRSWRASRNALSHGFPNASAKPGSFSSFLRTNLN